MWYLVIAVVVVVAILVFGSLNALVFSGPLTIGPTPTVTFFRGKLWVLMLLPFVVGLVLGVLLGALVAGGRRAPVPPSAPRP